MFCSLDPSTYLIPAVLVPLIYAWVGRKAGSSLIPRLPPCDPEQAPSRRDRVMNVLSHVLALPIAGVCALVLRVIPAVEPPAEGMRLSIYDTGMHWLGPLFVGLAVAMMAQVWLAQRMVAPGPLLHLMHGASKRYSKSDADIRPLVRLTGLVIISAALVLHLGFRADHLTLDAAGVGWRSFPWMSDQHRDWAELRAVEVVRTSEALSGRVVDRPHLRLRFADGEVVTSGTHETRPIELWHEAADYAAGRSGVSKQVLDK